MKTVKRSAKAGERVLITNAGYSFGLYENGDVFEAQRSRDNGAVWIRGNGVNVELHISEYEVIIEEETHAETNEA